MTIKTIFDTFDAGQSDYTLKYFAERVQQDTGSRIQEVLALREGVEYEIQFPSEDERIVVEIKDTEIDLDGFVTYSLNMYYFFQMKDGCKLSKIDEVIVWLRGLKKLCERFYYTRVVSSNVEVMKDFANAQPIYNTPPNQMAKFEIKIVTHGDIC